MIILVSANQMDHPVYVARLRVRGYSCIQPENWKARWPSFRLVERNLFHQKRLCAPDVNGSLNRFRFNLRTRREKFQRNEIFRFTLVVNDQFHRALRNFQFSNSFPSDSTRNALINEIIFRQSLFVTCYTIGNLLNRSGHCICINRISLVKRKE